MLAVGDKVKSDWNKFIPTTHVVKAVRTQKGYSQSGIQVQVAPALRGLKKEDWIDQGWFNKVTGE